MIARSAKQDRMGLLQTEHDLPASEVGSSKTGGGGITIFSDASTVLRTFPSDSTSKRFRVSSLVSC